MFARSFFAFILCLLCANARAQESDPRDVALALARAGVELLEAGDAEGAYRSFAQAEQHFHAPTHVLYMARARARQHLLLEARALYRRVVAENLGTDPTAPFVEAQANARKELAALEPRIPTLTVTIPAGATLDVDGTTIARTPVSLNPGKHTVIARASGRDPIVRTVTLREAAHEKLSLAWPRPAPAPAPRVAVQQPPERPWIGPAIASFALGVLGVTAGTITGVITLNRVAELDERCPERVCPLAEEEGADDIRTLSHVSTAAFVLGGVGVVAGVVLVIARPGETSIEARGGQLWLRSTF